MDVNRLPVNNGSAAGTFTDDGSQHFCNWYRSIVRRTLEGISLNPKNHSIVGLTQPCCILCNHAQHRLEVSRRGGDYAKNLASRGLLLLSLAEFPRLRRDRAFLRGDYLF